MWKLTIEDDEGKQTSLPLAHEEYGLGRGEHNTIRLTDRNISRKHAVLKKNGQGWHLADLQSYNGTYVNGVRVVGEQLIQSGDVVQLGDYRLEIADEAAAQPENVAHTQTGDQQRHPHQRPDRLVVVVGPSPGQEFPLDKEHFTIGRSEEATISINHSSVSRIHAELIPIGNGRYEVVDKASANGIRINGVELKRGILEAGDALELGDVRLRFVGAGKIFRAGADQSQQLQAVGNFESVAPSVRAPAAPLSRNGSSIVKLVGVGAVVGLALVLLFVFLNKNGPAQADPNSTAAPKPGPTQTNDDSAKILKDAQTLLQQKDFDGAHNKALMISESSPLRDDPGFKAIEDGWADWMFGEAEKAQKPEEKRKLLNKIATTASVDPVRRTKAGELIKELDAISPPPTAIALDPQGPHVVHDPALFTGDPYATVTTPPPPRSASTSASSPGGDVDPSSEGIRSRLGPKVWSGRASVDEMRMLKAACRALHDDACKNRVDGMLKKKLDATQ